MCAFREKGPNFKLVIATVALVVISMGTPAVAQQSGQSVATLAENLTTQLLALNAQYRSAATSDKAAILTELSALAMQRQQILGSLMENDPSEVLKVALPDNLWASLPASVQTVAEQEIDVTGRLEVLVEDSQSGSKLHYGLSTAMGKLALHFTGEHPTNLLTGSVVRASGVQMGGALVLACCNTTNTTTNSLQAVAAALPNTFGAQNTLVMLVNFQDNPTQPYTPATAQSVVFTTTSNFDMENSFQQTWLTGDVAGWFTIGLNSTNCDTSSIASAAQAAAKAAGYNLGAYSRYVYAFPQTSACNFWGWSTVGGNPSQSWINGSFQLKVVGHELGHGFGLYHSHALNCGTTVIGPNCTVVEYGDSIDIMGNPWADGFSSFQKERLGWLNNGSQPAITSVTSSGTYQIGPYEVQNGTARALKILQSTSSSGNKYYYLEYRQATGFDSTSLAGNTNVANGLVIHLGTDTDANSGELLNMTPGGSWSYPALGIGDSYTDSSAGITIAPTAVGSSGASVKVTFGSSGTSTCVPGNPLVSISPSKSQWVTAGTAVSFTVSVTNNDNSACSTSSFNLASKVPSGWTATFSNSLLILNSGATASTTLQVTSPVGTVDGFYNVSAIGTNSSNIAYSASAAATYVIATGTLSETVSTNQSTYTLGQTVYATVILTMNGTPFSGASVTITVTKPSGTTVSFAVTTDANGAATAKYRIKHQDSLGAYHVLAASSSSNGSSTQASTSFMVQ